MTATLRSSHEEDLALHATVADRVVHLHEVDRIPPHAPGSLPLLEQRHQFVGAVHAVDLQQVDGVDAQALERALDVAARSDLTT
ncbi:MAG: hypothetical protein H0V80_15090 [Acidobacteria bacterium]|nr:hypothetical protein [Acidobacteriota bacterium]